MPELPEVETVKRGLQPVMEGEKIDYVEVNRPNLRWPFPENMAERLAGRTITLLRRRSKYLLADLDSGETLIIHLGMSGRMLIEHADTAHFHNGATIAQKHDHVVFHMEDSTRIAFNDARRFGAMDLTSTQSVEQHWLISKLGPEPLGNEFSESYLTNALQKKSAPIKTALLDQHIVAGLGNIYVCEVLFRTAISPKRKASNLSANRAGSLVPAIREVLSEAIHSGGSSLRDHRQTNGDLGYFQHNFAVYDREGEPCRNDCGSKIFRIVQSGRSSFYCPKCQR
ncbi:bifunctional DNA-formamidopyrimidine glycosylase/DNA-(apurinic or apyrimidinic site) lyase [Litoreibacter janthinus]|uniref:Formamidopyrimidine-DNA glycosylase n=1 Tax=Litoreibacter janthinus TaxID=670154 RepID=A0A1I6FUK7_9RHOB|nr:bifunctional DNA-formamidopyrimidine glycosylase/DNA-(apurinic or apyrimidinic site) lyase [Litoreibacter janthinus]SFR33629.1 DNA-(apurinic or apyrimidinic site) lyase [Litoreibacter janthinus]